MSVMTGPLGTFVISWSQTEIDGLSGAPVIAVERGATWLWRGQAIRIDEVAGIGAPGAARLDAAASARWLVGRALAEEGVPPQAFDGSDGLDRAFTLTDGRRRWTVTLIELVGSMRPLLMFDGGLPPEGVPLHVIEGLALPSLPRVPVRESEGVVCFTPGTCLDTDGGPRAVEDIVAGDRLQTKDNGYQDVLWVGSRQISGARLHAMPDLRPVRIRQGVLGSDRPSDDLIVSPDHRLIVRGDAPLALWGESEVLISARDLIDDYGVLRDTRAKSVTYIHLMLEHHNVLFANGVETESFHPGAAALGEVDEEQRLRLFDVMPALEQDVSEYGPMSRRVLNRAEAALLSAA